ncbi:MAG: ABC transporter permease [Gemmatimonadota bacterium]|nr:ABC transporter permease [Gemmatimonadota bacterium]
MARYLFRRLAQVAVVVALVATIAFILIHLAPGDPFGAAMDNPNVTDAVRAQWRAAYGLDRPLPQQFASYLGSVARGDLGWSFSLQRPVIDVLRDALPNTLLLMSIALATSFSLGIALAIAQASRPGSLTDRVLGGISLFFFSVPEFWLALMVIVLLAYRFPIFPIGGMVDSVMHSSLTSWGKFIDIARHTVLPAATLTLLFSAVVARYQRAALLDVLPAEYVRTARAKGVPERSIVRRHALRNALLPVITLFGLAFPALLTGAVFVEKVFAWPGMGLVIVNSIESRDYPLLMASVIIGSVLVAVGSLLADLLYRVADPRIRDDR